MTHAPVSDRLGRPMIPDDQKLDQYIGITVAKEMRERLIREAHAAGYRSLSAFIREQKLAQPADERSA